MAGRKWEDSEIEFLKSNFEEMSCAEIGKKLQRTTKSVQHQFNTLGLERSNPKVGEIYGRLKILEIYEEQQYNTIKTMAKCECQCDKKTICNRRLTAIKKGKVQSCGCLTGEKARERIIKRNYKHGKGSLDNRLYRIWNAIKTRCFNQNIEYYNDYGGRGITICQEWKDDFEKFESWSINNGYQDNLTIDRINVDGNYEPNNCRWSDSTTQANNRRSSRAIKNYITAFGERKSLLDWLQDSRCQVESATTVCYRIGAGWTPEAALSTKSKRDYS